MTDISELAEVRHIGPRTVQALDAAQIFTLEQLAGLDESSFEAMPYRVRACRRGIRRYLAEERGLSVSWPEWRVDA